MVPLFQAFYFRRFVWCMQNLFQSCPLLPLYGTTTAIDGKDA
jgi:hypothetical protein